MTGTVELAPDRQNLLVRFPYRPDLVDEVKSLARRRWDKGNKTWIVPVELAEQIYQKFARHLFEFAPEVMSLVAGTLGTAAPVAEDDEAGPRTPPVEALSLSGLNARVRDTLRQAFPQGLWVTGEMLDFDKGEGRRMRFFRLVEKHEGEPKPRASVEAVLFADTAEALLRRLAAAPEPLVLRDGIEIRALVRVDLYPDTGQYRLIVDDIDPTFTLGKLALDRERILRELRRRGLDQRNLRLPLPVPALRIGVLTSESSDGWNDFRRHLEESAIGFQLTLLPIAVQGQGLKRDLLAGLRWFAGRAADFDVLCVVRGGGSRTDLAWFDDLDVAVAVAQHPLKILVGIGHQRDRSVLDEIAHSEKTPTAVATFLVECVGDARQQLDTDARRLRDGADGVLAAARTRLRDDAWRLRTATGLRLTAARGRLENGAARLLRETRGALLHGRRLLVRCTEGLGRHALLHLQRERAGLQSSRVQLARSAGLVLERARATLDRRADRVRLLDPRAVLRRGFALLRDPEGRLITGIAGLRPDQDLTLVLRDGTAGARTTAIHPTEPTP